jgi:TolB-like protein
MSFIAELKRRKVFRVGAAYLVAAWLAVQAASIALPAFDAPAWAMRVVILLFALGFPLALFLAWALEISPDGVRLDIANAGGKRMLGIAAALAVLALGWYFHDRLPQRDPGDAAPPGIAVLPLVNASGDAGQQFFSDGLSENLIIALSQFQGLKVIGRTSSFQFRDGKEDARAIGRRLGVGRLLEGSVQHVGDAVRISAELIDAADGRTLWSQRYDRPYKDLFALQDEIAQAVATALQSRLLPNAHAAAQNERPPSGSIEAYNAYLQGKFDASRGTDPSLAKAIERFTDATRLDPRYAAAWAKLGATRASLAEHLEGDARRQAIASSRKALDTALALAPDLGIAHAGQAYLLVVADQDWPAADAEFRRAAQLNPGYSPVWAGQSILPAAFGRLHDALRLTAKAESVDPLDWRWPSWRSQLLSALGRFDDSEAALRRVAELRPGADTEQHVRRQQALHAVLRGDAAAALAAARRGDIEPVLALPLGPDRAAADAALRTLVEQRGDQDAYLIAIAYAQRGDADRTFAWLDRTDAAHDAQIKRDLLLNPFLLRFRDDPRLAAFAAGIGLPSPAGSEALSIDQIRGTSTPAAKRH